MSKPLKNKPELKIVVSNTPAEMPAAEPPPEQVEMPFAIVNGEHFSSYYLFYGSLAFAIFYVSLLRAAYERLTAFLLRAAGYHRRALIVGRRRS